MTSLFFLGTEPVSRRSTSLTFQGDFCVSMTGRGGALRCKKQRDCCTNCSHTKEAEGRAAAHEMNLGRNTIEQNRIPQSTIQKANAETDGVMTEQRRKRKIHAVEACPAALASKINSDKNHNPKRKRTSMSSKTQHKTPVKRRENTAFMTMHGQTHMRQRFYGVCVLRAPQQVTCSNDVHAARRERSPARAQPSPSAHAPSQPGVSDETEGKNDKSGERLESAFPVPRRTATMSALPALRVAGAAAQGGAFRVEQPLSL